MARRPTSRVAWCVCVVDESLHVVLVGVADREPWWCDSTAFTRMRTFLCDRIVSTWPWRLGRQVRNRLRREVGPDPHAIDSLGSESDER